MPTYTYKCDGCGREYEEFFTLASQREELIETEPCEPGCPGVVKYIFKAFPFGIIKVGAGWPDKDRAIDKHIQEVHRAMDEPACPTEIETGLGMLAEREKEKGLPEGALSGNRPTETVEVASDTGAIIDRVELAKKLDNATGNKMDIDKVAEMTNDKIKQHVGSTVKVERVKRMGKENLKSRAKSQASERYKKV